MRNLSNCLLLLTLVTSSIHAADWPQWRGPGFNGSSVEKNLPAKWSQTENIAWRAPLPGSSGSTPVIWGDRVFISGVDKAKETLLAMCFDRKNGAPLWRKTLGRGISRDSRSTYAAPSPVTDGKRVIFFYGNGLLACFDMKGTEKWSRNICDDYGEFAFLWTFASSPALYDGILYVQVLQRNKPVRGKGKPNAKSYILAMNPQTGKTLWQHFRPSKAREESLEAFSTPIPITLNGTKQLAIVGGDAITGHDLKTGKELWRWGTWNPGRITHFRLVPSPVEGGGVVLACGPKQKPIYAIRPDKKGTLDDGAIAWRSKDTNKLSSDVPTPAFYDGDFFILNDLRKRLSRVDPKTGTIKWTIDTPGRSKYEASPLAADGKIYIISHEGTASVINAKNGAIINTIPMDDAGGRKMVRASIIASYGQLFLRTTTHLYCIGK